MEKLPLDIILDILLSLPDQSIINCKLVCKPWRDLLRNIKLKLDLLFLVRTKRYERKYRQFYHGGHQYDDIDMHGSYSYKTLAKFDNYPTPPDSCSKMVGSCNGLVCFSLNHGSVSNDPIHICNLNTGEYVNLPKYWLSSDGDFISAFGYSYSTDDYKVVRMFVRNDYPSWELRLIVQVYTLGSGLGWRDKGTENFFISKAKASVCANGALHWIEIKKRKVVAFDLADEKFILIPLPSVYSGYNGDFTVKLLRGYLSVFNVDTEQGGTFVTNIWSLKKKKQCSSYGTGEDDFNNYWSWNKEFTIPWDRTITNYRKPPVCDLVAVTKSDQVLLWFRGVLCCYDSKATTLKELWQMDSLTHCVEAYPHLNSLVSLEALGEESRKRI